MAKTLFFRMVFRKFWEITKNKPIFSQCNIFYNYEYFFFQSAFWSLFNHCQRSQSNQGQCNMCCCLSVFLFCCALTTGRCNAFQHNFVNQKSSAACISRLCYFLWLWFDTVNHNILLKKLKLYDIENNDLRCFKSYLSRRKQQKEN